jgi:hypothetical protein
MNGLPVDIHSGDRDDTLPGIEPLQFFTCGGAAA